MIRGTFLGTASIPTPERNPHGILLDFHGQTSLLLDCGEGVQRQLLRTDADLRLMDRIFITHEHVDHLYGITGVLLLLLKRHPEKRLLLHAPRKAAETCMALASQFLPREAPRIEVMETKEGETIDHAAYRCTSFRTYHTETSMGYCFSCNGRIMAFLGDVGLPGEHAGDAARARGRIIDAVREADVLVADAVHISPGEAAGIAKAAQVKRLYLVPIPLGRERMDILKEAEREFPDVVIPGDFERFER